MLSPLRETASKSRRHHTRHRGNEPGSFGFAVIARVNELFPGLHTNALSGVGLCVPGRLWGRVFFRLANWFFSRRAVPSFLTSNLIFFNEALHCAGWKRSKMELGLFSSVHYYYFYELQVELLERFDIVTHCLVSLMNCHQN